jgi:hypothetical protein
MRRIGALYADHAFYGWRRIAFELKMTQARAAALRPWGRSRAYGRAYANSEERAEELPARLAATIASALMVVSAQCRRSAESI